MIFSIVERTEVAGRMDRKLGCRFVGHGEKTEKSPCSSAPSCPFDTAYSLIKLTHGYVHGSARNRSVLRITRGHGRAPFHQLQGHASASFRAEKSRIVNLGAIQAFGSKWPAIRSAV
ncbi:hypothetical protein DXT93_12915 [Agrobacterium rhizogenes]|nr:hypothetical protein [Rhizobium rhizogenes]